MYEYYDNSVFKCKIKSYHVWILLHYYNSVLVYHYNLDIIQYYKRKIVVTLSQWHKMKNYLFAYTTGGLIQTKSAFKSNKR